ncbi:MAG: carbohydrate binding domain-containing protein [Dictyoglomus thermophilum]|uniref:Laminarinase n=1 Tax=Dictyoglomus thermophilum TaxID=14 RepID=A0A7V4DY16_DICTH|nr:carbohydrate binding domain-containing protein [Dictyoglomus thermophilum]MCX7720150.1 carbohydrate binding domain-containing protein [Dictyoglomus thermophilum]TYT23382.1 laminarinase [Dictyoglomus thermophilum]
MKKIYIFLLLISFILFIAGCAGSPQVTQQETAPGVTEVTTPEGKAQVINVTKLGVFNENLMFSAPSNWYIVVQGTAEVEEYGAKGGFFYVKIKNPGDAFWHIQFGTHVPLPANKKYKLTFEAKADAERDLQVRVIQDQTWEIVESTTFNLTTEVQKFEWEFTPKKDGHIIVFDMGKISEKSIATTIYIANVELVEE